MTIKFILAAALSIAFVPLALCADKELDAMQGTWLPTAAELAGEKYPAQVRKTIKLIIAGDKYTATVGTQTDVGTLKLDPAAKPKAMDILGSEGPNKDKTIQCIYELNGDTLKICYDLSGKSRPTEFATKTGTQLFLVTYARDKR